MKKVIAALMVLAMALTMAACGGEGNSSAGGTSSTAGPSSAVGSSSTAAE